VWVDKSLSLQTSFKQIVSSDYEATLASVDFITKVCIICTAFISCLIILSHKCM
jgi:hypothetical protein